MGTFAKHIFTEAEKEFLSENGHLDKSKLLLKAAKLPQVDGSKLVDFLEARQKLLKKVPSWKGYELDIPSPLVVEQASSEETASFKQARWSGETLADLTGGLGIDSYFFSFSHRRIDYVEQQAGLCQISQYNLNHVLGRENITCHYSTAEDFLRKENAVYDTIFIDPARRRAGQKVFLLEDCSPDVAALHDRLLARAKKVLMKLSPLIDLQELVRKLPNLCRIVVVSVKNECKEVLAELWAEKSGKVEIEAVNIEAASIQSFSFLMEDEATCLVSYQLPGNWLYVPHAAVAKSGGFKSVAKAYGLDKLHPSTHLYTSNDLIPGFPGRSFRCIAVLSGKEVKQQVGQAVVLCRNFPLKPAEVAKKYKIKEGGHQYLFACKGFDGHQQFILATLAVI